MMGTPLRIAYLSILATVAVTTPGAAATQVHAITAERTSVAAPQLDLPDPTPPDYSDPTNWLKVPKHPKAPRHRVDVFYLYPTSYAMATPSSPVIGPVTDPGMRAGAQESYDRQATAFAPYANIYAPYYRQIDTATKAQMPQAEQDLLTAGIPTTDAIAAFDYYLRHYNDGRPFILVGHSIGSNVLANMLGGYFKKHPSVYSRMVAAYVVGFAVTRAFLDTHPYLTFARNSTDTGVIVSWNTEAPDFEGVNPVLDGNIGLVINPLTWSHTTHAVPATESLGSLLPTAAGPWIRANHYADAQIDLAKGVLICSTCDETLLATHAAALR
ncbi:MAG: DUF3089 domain-containing protein [Actinomycetota bacterium]|nr:DUF3089 domain-containing protein [Actinomycetota bacterium]